MRELCQGSDHSEGRQSKQQADEHMASATRVAPKSWPMEDVQQLFWNAAWGATNSRVHKLARMTDFQYSLFHKKSEDRQDWPRYHEYSKKVKAQLGQKNAEAYEHIDGMLVNAAWGAANERWYGKHSNSAVMHWKKFDYHFETGRDVYKGPVEWSDIREMISGACWGAANERACAAARHTYPGFVNGPATEQTLTKPRLLGGVSASTLQGSARMESFRAPAAVGLREFPCRRRAVEHYQACDKCCALSDGQRACNLE